MSAKVTATGFGEMSKMFLRAADALNDEAVFRDIAHAALRPVADGMYERVQKRSGQTADDIRIADEESTPGHVRVAVGFGPGKTGRGHIARMLEYGTPRMRAYPFIRPAYDAVGGPAGVSREVARAVEAILKAALS